MLRNLLSRIIGDSNDSRLAKLQPLIEKINSFETAFQELSEDVLKAKTADLQQRVAQGEALDDLLPEAFAVVKNACRRLAEQKASWDVRGNETVWGMIPYDVQLLGGAVMHAGSIAEMKTGEGKTLVCTLPLYLNALVGKGCHLITANNYLARRDSEWMAGLFNYLGMTVGVLDHGMAPDERKAAYACDITYGTNTEFGFDYLRDNMARSTDEQVQRGGRKLGEDYDGHAFAIVDEVDSILIDEARTPLIVSAPAEDSTEKYAEYARLIQGIEKDVHYELDEKAKTATLNEAGIQKMEELLGVNNIYTERGYEEVHHIENALKAQAVFTRDKDYVVQDGEIMIVDEFTGRLMPGRRYSDGLHQALEAKERVEIRKESRTLASVTLQNYFRMYEKLAGMTGTALTEAEEFHKIYGLDVVVIPTNREVARHDLPDAVYKNETGKLIAVAAKVKELSAAGQPVLIGTVTIEKSELISSALKKEGIAHAVLNAKHHEQEAEIIARAGERGAVTIATNMAGRGTDIKLGEGVADLGGLFILGTERHESRRIDNQLRGRAGRQGDPGASQFFVSMEDSLMRLFGGAKMQGIMNALNVPDDMPIENRIISGSIESAQKKVEAHNFDIRKHLVEYDDVMNKHRSIIYTRRQAILEHGDISNEIQILISEEARGICDLATVGRDRIEWDISHIIKRLHDLYQTAEPLSESKLKEFLKPAELAEYIEKYLIHGYAKKVEPIPAAAVHHSERQVYLTTIDRLWMEHIDSMRFLREKVSLRGYGQRDPLMEYKGEAFQIFELLLGNIRANTVNALFHLQVQQAPISTNQITPQPIEIKTNEDEIEDILTGDREFTADEKKEVARATTDFMKVDKKKADLGKDGISIVRTDNSTAVKIAQAENPNVIRVSSSQSLSNSSEKEIGRNNPCPCGSGKKYKKCCGMN